MLIINLMQSISLLGARYLLFKGHIHCFCLRFLSLLQIWLSGGTNISLDGQVLLQVPQQMLAGLLPDPLRHGGLQGHPALLPQLQGRHRQARRLLVLRMKKINVIIK